MPALVSMNTLLKATHAEIRARATAARQMVRAGRIVAQSRARVQNEATAPAKEDTSAA